MRTVPGLLVAVLGGCASASAPPARAPARPVATATVTSPSEVPGGLSEEEFARLHTLREDGAPASKGEMVKLEDGTEAYLSLPEGKQAPRPGVVVIHEWWGLNEHIKHWADRLAADGYAALAVDLYGGVVATDRETAMATMKKVDEAKASATVRAARKFLQTDPRVLAPKMASIGWCFGGGWSLRMALLEPELDAAVIYYGHVPTDAAALAPVRAHILGVFGNQDTGIPPATVDAFEKALAQNGTQHRILRYDAPHAFANPSGPAYHAAEAAAAWAEVRAFLAAELDLNAGTPATAP